MSAVNLHDAVLLDEAVVALDIKPNGIYVDATFGRGGHSKAVLSKLSESGKLIVLDRDPAAIIVADQLAQADERVVAIHSPFSAIAFEIERLGLIGLVDGVLFDLGVSSPQLDDAQRGFSFMRDGPLDMRMNPMTGVSAADWIACASEKEIADVMYQYGEERHSRRIARWIVQERQLAPIETTGRLAEIVKDANPAWEKDKHPATRAFQGIRIFLNDEFKEIELALDSALSCLRKDGRLVVISFHSLEDRIVKKFMAKQTKGDSYPRDLPITADHLNPTIKLIGKALKAGRSELARNPRARSAVMRVCEKTV